MIKALTDNQQHDKSFEWPWHLLNWIISISVFRLEDTDIFCIYKLKFLLLASSLHTFTTARRFSFYNLNSFILLVPVYSWFTLIQIWLFCLQFGNSYSQEQKSYEQIKAEIMASNGAEDDE